MSSPLRINEVLAAKKMILDSLEFNIKAVRSGGNLFTKMKPRVRNDKIWRESYLGS